MDEDTVGDDVDARDDDTSFELAFVGFSFELAFVGFSFELAFVGFCFSLELALVFVDPLEVGFVAFSLEFGLDSHMIKA